MADATRLVACYLYGWPAIQAIEVIYGALADAVPELVPAWSGGDLCGLTWWGRREATGETWADSSPNPIGMGAHASGDGSHGLLHVAESATRFSPIEVWEERDPLVVERYQLPLGRAGGGAGRPNAGCLRSPAGDGRPFGKATRMAIPVGWTIEVGSGGGGGYGDPLERPAARVEEDVIDGFVSEAYAARHYPQWSESGSEAPNAG